MTLAVTPRNLTTATALLFVTMVVFNCGGGGGDDVTRYNESKQRAAMKEQYIRDPKGFKKRWGVD